METKTMPRSKFASIFIAVGAIFLVPGFVLWLFDIGKKTIYDLPIFLMIIGIALAAYGVFQLVATERLGDSVDISPKAISAFLMNNAILLALMVMVVVIAVISPKFIQVTVMRDILAQSSTKLILALGIVFTLLIGGTDLAAGRLVGLAAVVSASMLQNPDYARRFWPDLPNLPVIIPVIIAIIACALFGLLDGFVVSLFDLPPFISSLAVMAIVYGANSLYYAETPYNKAQPIGGIRPDFANIGQYRIADYLPVLIIFAVAVTILIWFILNKTIFGKNVYAVGGNRQAAAVSGVNVRLTVLCIFVLAAALYGLSGVLEAARTAGATNNYGFSYEMDAIAACVIGGVSLSGGVGKVRGIVVGSLILTVISYGLTFLGLSIYWQQIIKGVIIIAAVAIDMTKARRK